MTDENSLLRQTSKDFGNGSGKIGRVRQDPGKRNVGQGPLERTIIEGLLEIEIAPVELNSLKERKTSKYLERIENGNTNLLRYLQHSRTNEQEYVND